MNRLFPELLAPKLHPANVGHDFTREGAVTPALLELYRARAVRMSLFQDDMKGAMEDLHAIFRMGGQADLLRGGSHGHGRLGSAPPGADALLHRPGQGGGPGADLRRLYFLGNPPHSGVHPHSGGGLCIPGDAVGGPLLRLPADGGETERKLWYCCRGLQFLEAGFESLTFDRRIPEETADWFRDKALLVFHGGIPAADFAQEGEERITCRWIAEKQREG